MYKHLKYGLPMINDVVRNSFYKKILKDTKNKNCLEIGFGTGILSILALEAGANHIVAYEEDLETYQLGLEVIQSLGLENKIELIGQQFRPENIHRHKNIDCIFTETINHTLFGESMLKAVRGPLPEILPNIYFLEVYDRQINGSRAFIKRKRCAVEAPQSAELYLKTKLDISMRLCAEFMQSGPFRQVTKLTAQLFLKTLNLRFHLEKGSYQLAKLSMVWS
jgi:hypothetical protein